MENQSKNANKPWYKIWWIWLIILIVLGQFFKTNKTEEPTYSSNSTSINNSEVSKISESDVIGIYNNFKMNYQFRIYPEGHLEFYTATSAIPHRGTWILSANKVKIRIPDWISEEINFTVKKDGLYTSDNKLIWTKA